MEIKMLLFLALLISCLYKTDAQIGVCYGMSGYNLPRNQEVVALYRQNNIRRMRLYGQDEDAFRALSGTDIELMLGVQNGELQGIASDQSKANSWVQNNIKRFPNVKFKYLAVGNEINTQDNSRYRNFLLPAMKNLHNAISIARLGDQIKVSTAFAYDVFQDTYPPSKGIFNRQIESFINPIVSFLIEKQSPFLLNMYPYFSHMEDQKIPLDYALFTATSVNSDGYQNLFDAMLDAAYFALEKVGGQSVKVVVSETGWPTAGGVATSITNAQTYNSRLIQHVKQGTRKRPGPIETYIFAMFNEDMKKPEYEKHWGLFAGKQAKYNINFN